jgi:hypothetical protein
MHEVQRGGGCSAHPGYIAGVRRYFGIYKDNAYPRFGGRLHFLSVAHGWQWLARVDLYAFLKYFNPVFRVQGTIN